MSTKEERKTFGCIVCQRPTKAIPRQEIEECCRNFLEDFRTYIAIHGHVKKADIETDIHYNTHTREVQGYLHVGKPVSETVIEPAYYYGKNAWRAQKTAPYDFYFGRDE